MTARKRSNAPDDGSVRALAVLAAREAVDRRAQDVVLLDLKGLTTATDFFVIASGESDVQVRALAERIEARLTEEEGRKPWHVEGQRHAQWVLLDYVDFVVHVFHQEARRYYEIERLWGDAPSESFNGHPPASEAIELHGN